MQIHTLFNPLRLDIRKLSNWR